METSLADLPPFKIYKINHHRQNYEWDCGLSCIQMILPSTERLKFQKNFDKICNEGEFGTSTWTIDLCYILKKFNIKHIYLTRTIGIDPTYLKSKYYKEVISKDSNRVNIKFKDASLNGIVVKNKTVSLDKLISHVGNYGPVIVLTNSSLLFCDSCNIKTTKDIKVGYTGHYIVLCGYDANRRKVFYRDPSRENHACIVSFETFDDARLAFGTDEDAILVFYNSYLK